MNNCALIKAVLPKIIFVIFLSAFCSLTAQAQNLETREIDLKGCIRTYFKQQITLQTKEDFDKAIDDASRKDCSKNLENIDFDKYSLIGIDLNTGYCRRPLLLKSWVEKDAAKKQFYVKITYIEPQGTCRALSSYDYWILIPKIPEKYSLTFDVSPENRSQEN